MGARETFLQDIGKNELVIHVKILAHGPPPEFTHPMMEQSTTKLEVLNVLKGNLKTDIVYFVNGAGAACQANIERMEIGKEIILKPESFDGEKGKNKIYLNGNICSRWMQPVENGRVIGSVTKNRMAKRYNKMNKLREKGDEKSLKRFEKLNERPLKMERIRIKKLKRKINRV